METEKSMRDYEERVDGYFYKLFNLENFSDYKDKVIFILLNLFLVQSAVQFYKFLDVKTITVACWPFFQNCGPIQDFILLNVNPNLRPLYFSILFFIFTASFYFLYKGRYGISFLISFIAFVYNLLPYIIFTDYYNPVVTYFNMYFFYTALIIFFSRHSRRELIAVFLALSYLFPGYSKLISEHWVIGLIPMPYISDEYMPIFTNLTIITQLVFPIVLLFGSGLVRKLTVFIQELYHAYSATLPTVGFNFLFYNGPLLIILFLDDKLKINYKIFKRNINAILIFVVFIFLSNIRILIPFNDSITKEGVYGINVFANPYRQNIEYQDREMKLEHQFSENKNFDPYIQLRQFRNIQLLLGFYPNYYALLAKIQVNCTDGIPRSLKVKMETFYNSYTVIDEVDYCSLKYNPFWHNKWIQPDGQYIEDVSKLSGLQRVLHDQRDVIEFFYTIVFYAVIVFGVYKFLEE